MSKGEQIKKLISEGKNDFQIVDETGAKLNYVKTLRNRIRKEKIKDVSNEGKETKEVEESEESEDEKSEDAEEETEESD